MAIWAVADLHLSFGVSNKSMDRFGPRWKDHARRLASSWDRLVSNDDLVLICGDISWAMRLEEALPDLNWIDRRPGTKLMIKGNHDYWFSSPSKVRRSLPSSCHFLHNDAFYWQSAAIAGTRLWDLPNISFSSLFPEPLSHLEKSTLTTAEIAENAKIYARELQRLEASLAQLNDNAKIKIAMTHYPPIGPNNQESDASKLLEKYGVNICVFGHLHNVSPETSCFGRFNGIDYHLTACDHLLEMAPLRLM